MVRYNLSFAGAGRVGTALCTQLHRTGYRIDLVVSRGGASAKTLAASCDASWSDKLNFPGSTDIIIVSVPDHSLGEVLSGITCDDKTLILHTAGSYGLEVFPGRFGRTGIFYPLQTFTQGRSIDISEVPFLLESSSPDIDRILEQIVKSIGAVPYFVNSDKRRLLHLSAVFVCNFTNFMLTAGKEISIRAGEPFEILKPLINETIAKALETGPENSQTGPAIRNDINTIEKHLDLLSFSPDLQKVYHDLTQAVIKYYRKSK